MFQMIKSFAEGEEETSVRERATVARWTHVDAAKMGFWIRHLLLPLLIASALLLWLELDGGNRWLADWIYAWGSGQWLLKQHWVTSVLIHPGGKYLSLLLWCTTLFAWWRLSDRPERGHWRKALGFLLLATLLSTSLVSLLKHLLPMDCPWDMLGYGGHRPYFGLFDARPHGLHASGCFPAGHAGSGYAWLASYFFLLRVAPRWRFHGLTLGLLMGGLFGVSQQLRGAHFASHDVASLSLCWISPLLLHGLHIHRSRSTQA